ISLKTLIAVGTPDFSTSYVSTRRTQLEGYISAYFLKASYSSSYICTQLCAIVPSAAIPKSRSDPVHAVPAQPPIYAARAPYIAAAVPWARLVPNSITGLPAADLTIRLALVAMRL